MEETNALNTQSKEEAKRAAARERKRASRKRINENPEKRIQARQNERQYAKERRRRNKQYSDEPGRKKWDKLYYAATQSSSGGNKIRRAYTSWSARPKDQRESYYQKQKAKSNAEKARELKLLLKQNAIESEKTLSSKLEKQRFLIDEMKMDAKLIMSFSDERLSNVYSDMFERAKEFKANSCHSDIVTSITAAKLFEAGTMLEGAGFFAVEACNAEAARATVFSAEEMVRVTVETSCNLSNIGHVAECQRNLEKDEVGFMYKKTTITQAGLDAVEGNLRAKFIDTFLVYRSCQNY
jgi:hypothetical protein